MADQDLKTAQSSGASQASIFSGFASDIQTMLTDDERRRMIAVAAYYRAEQRGFIVDDWLAAEHEIDLLLKGPSAVLASALSSASTTADTATPPLPAAVK